MARLVKTIEDMKSEVKKQRCGGKTIGLVPTMGFLHEGHVSLIKASVRNNDFTVASIFVNPTQFGQNEDYDKYPRDMKRDFKIAEEAGLDVVFAPTVSDMYPCGFDTSIVVNGISKILCGKSRPGHFQGVATVVNKLFNIIEPDRAYFGQKDAQQVAVIKKMVEDLNMNLEVVVCPTIRESDGLAMSSRNVFLAPEERKAAAVLPKALFEVEVSIMDGERNKEKLLSEVIKRIKENRLIEVDYVDIRHADTFESFDELKGKVLAAAAIKVGTTRLIDNIVIEVPE